MDKKKLKIIKRVIVVLISIIVIELLIMGIIKIIRERKLEHVDSLFDVVAVNDGYVAVGVSDFSNSDFVDKKIYEHLNSTTHKKERIIANQAKIVKYNKNKEILWEKTFDGEYDSSYYGILEVQDGYIAVGSYISKKSQIDDDVRDALIVKYDKDGKILWHKSYSVLSDTEFYKAIADDDNNIIVIGQSIYQNMELGTHYTGGGIIVRYNSDGEELAHNNYGRNKSGKFTDIIKVKDGYIVCGKDATNYGIVVKFPKDFNRDENDRNEISKKVMWQRTYSNTDNEGFLGMTQVDDKIYAIGSINVSDEKDEEGKTKFKYAAGIVEYNINGKYLGKAVLDEQVHHRFISAVSDEKNLYLTGLYDVDKTDADQKSFNVVYHLSNEIDVKNKFSDIHVFNNDNNYIINKIYTLNDDSESKICIGTNNSHCSLLGCKYQSFIENCDNTFTK